MSTDRNPAEHVKPFQEKKRERFLDEEKVRHLVDVLDRMTATNELSSVVNSAIKLLLMTGCRCGEILGLKWSDIDFDAGTITFERHKTDQKGKKILPMNNATRQLLDRTPRITKNPYVIPGNVDGKLLVNLQKPWRKLRKKANLDDVRLHDLRHTFASRTVNAGIPLTVIGGLLGHESSQSTQRYAHLAIATLAKASDLVTENL